MKRYLSEFLGTTFLLMTVVGSGIMGEKLAGGNEAIALLANSIATGAGLFVIITCIGPISGAHLNPAVSIVELFWGRLKKRDLLGYLLAQFIGAILGVWLSHMMFNLPVMEVSTKQREGGNLLLSEFLATFGLISVISLAGRKRVEWAPVTIAAYITAAYWFTSSTSFVNPAVTVARTFTNTFCGIAPSGTLPFILAQFLGAIAAYVLLRKIESVA